MKSVETKHVQTITGTVVKRSSTHTIRVATKVTKVHPIYKKRYTLHKHYLVHDPSESVEVGDSVVIAPTPPVSKMKKWVVVQKIDA